MHQCRDPVLHRPERRGTHPGVPLEVPGRVRLVVVPVQRGQCRGGIGRPVEQAADEMEEPDDLAEFLRPDTGQPAEDAYSVKYEIPTSSASVATGRPPRVSSISRTARSTRSMLQWAEVRFQEGGQCLSPGGCRTPARAELRPTDPSLPGPNQLSRDTTPSTSPSATPSAATPQGLGSDAGVARRPRLGEHVRPGHDAEQAGLVEPVRTRHRIVPVPRLRQCDREGGTAVRDEDLPLHLGRPGCLDHPVVLDDIALRSRRWEAKVGDHGLTIWLLRVMS